MKLWHYIAADNNGDEMKLLIFCIPTNNGNYGNENNIPRPLKQRNNNLTKTIRKQLQRITTE